MLRAFPIQSSLQITGIEFLFRSVEIRSIPTRTNTLENIDETIVILRFYSHYSQRKNTRENRSERVKEKITVVHHFGSNRVRSCSNVEENENSSNDDRKNTREYGQTGKTKMGDV